MTTTISISDSLIGSLSREADHVRSRIKYLQYTIYSCKDNMIKNRLLKEIDNLKKRRKELKEISNIFLNNSKSNISNLLFFELCNRPLEVV